MKKVIVLLVILSCFFISCKKDKVNPSSVVCNLDTNRLIASWKIVSDIEFVTINTIPASSSPLADTSFEIFSDTRYYPTCKTDDLYELNHGGNFVYNDAGVSCSPSGSNFNGTWSLNANQLILNTDTFQVTHFECNKLMTSSPTYSYDTTYMGVPIRIIAHYNTTFSKQ